MQNPEASGKIHAEFFIYGYRLSSVFDTRRRLLGDIFYDPTTSYIEVQEAFLSPIDQPMHITHSYTRAILIKEQVSLALTTNAQDSLRSDQRHYRGRYETTLVITLPFFDITGKHFGTSLFKLNTFLGVQAGAFLTLLDVTARCTFHSDVTYQGGAAIINTSHISCIGIAT